VVEGVQALRVLPRAEVASAGGDVLEELRIPVVRGALAVVEQRERENAILVAHDPRIGAELAVGPGGCEERREVGLERTEQMGAKGLAAEGGGAGGGMGGGADGGPGRVAADEANRRRGNTREATGRLAARSEVSWRKTRRL